jgi:hypothetical protein
MPVPMPRCLSALSVRAWSASARWWQLCPPLPWCAVLSIEGGPLVSLAVATNILAALTGTAPGGVTIALDALGETYLRLAAEQGIDPALLHRVAVMSAGTPRQPPA